MGPHEDNGRIVYGDFMTTLLIKNITTGALPAVVTNPNRLEEQAKETMTSMGYNFVSISAGEGATIDANRLAFLQWKLVSRVLRKTGPRDLSINLFGEKLDTPVLMAPIGINSLMHPDKEIGVAAACAALKIPYTISGASSTTYEELAQAVPTGRKWCQFYWPKDNELSISLLSRAKASGCKVLVYTVDSWILGWRPLEMDSGNSAHIAREGGVCMSSDPVFQRTVERLAEKTPAEDRQAIIGGYWREQLLHDFSHSWEDLQFLRENWDGPIVIKGILTAEDAILAVQYGVDGIIVSNHGGRQIDGCVGTMDVLPEIVEAVGDKLPVMIDSGFRTGADIVKALALGAKAVFVGRPVVFGLGINGREGAQAVLAGILADLDLTMGLIGAERVSDLSPSMLRRIYHPGDVRTRH